MDWGSYSFCEKQKTIPSIEIRECTHLSKCSWRRISCQRQSMLLNSCCYGIVGGIIQSAPQITFPCPPSPQPLPPCLIGGLRIDLYMKTFSHRRRWLQRLRLRSFSRQGGKSVDGWRWGSRDERHRFRFSFVFALVSIDAFSTSTTTLSIIVIIAIIITTIIIETRDTCNGRNRTNWESRCEATWLRGILSIELFVMGWVVWSPSARWCTFRRVAERAMGLNLKIILPFINL